VHITSYKGSGNGDGLPTIISGASFTWAKILMEHYQHDGFIFNDSPVNLVIGFSCTCNGECQNWTTTLSDFKKLPKAVHEFINALRAREQILGTPWFVNQQEHQKKLAIEAKRINGLLTEIAKLTHQLNKRKLSSSKRTRLRHRRARLDRLLRSHGKTVIHDGLLQGKCINAK
jgi:hypothetical protein